MKYLRIRDEKNRIFYQKNEIKKIYIDYILHNKKISLKFRQYIQMKYYFDKKKYSFIRLNDRCILTNTNRSVNRSLHISKMVLRKLIMEGRFSGIAQASW